MKARKLRLYVGTSPQEYVEAAWTEGSESDVADVLRKLALRVEAQNPWLPPTVSFSPRSHVVVQLDDGLGNSVEIKGQITGGSRDLTRQGWLPDRGAMTFVMFDGYGFFVPEGFLLSAEEVLDAVVAKKWTCADPDCAGHVFVRQLLTALVEMAGGNVEEPCEDDGG